MDLWDRIEHVYHGARDLDRADRVRFLDKECGTDAALRRQVEALLAQDDTLDSFLNRPVADVVAGWRSAAEHQLLRAGSSVGPYEVVESVGAGGMGEVYRARDTKLDRDVALKVLPEGFSLDRDRLARFTREAQVLASLNHPNIAAIYELEDAGGVQALVLEFVEGPTLAERMSQGPMPPDDALPIVRQIADALEAAHAHGIIHRDLKPSNIKVRPDGTVKILDFGLAKALEPIGTPQDSSNPATATSPGITRDDVILGTAPYMSPEQARGLTVDQRADIWAFGVVLYEMLTGRQPFLRSTVPDTLAAVLKEDPDWTIVPPETDTLLRRCLEKNPARRLRHVGDALPLLGLREAPAPGERGRRGSMLTWWVCAVFGVLATVLAIRQFRDVKRPADAIRFQVPIPDRVAHGRVAFAVSPDGRQIALTSMNGGSYWLRALDTLESRELTGADRTSGGWPFWSADSRFLVYDATGKLKKIDVAGGPAQTVCELRTRIIGASMNRRGAIIFGSVGGIMRVPENGGNPAPSTRLDASRHETVHSSPVFLADGRHYLYLREAENPDDSAVYVGALDAEPAEQSARPVLVTRYSVSYVPPVSGDRGQVLFVRQGTLLVQSFDERTLSVTGDPVPIVDRVETSYSTAFFSASTTGVLVFKDANPPYQLTWLDGRGRPLDPVGDPDFYDGLALSPDGSKAAASQQGSLWLLDLTRGGARTRFAVGMSPAWAPDGTRVAFTSLRNGTFALFSKGLGGSQEEALGPSSSSESFGPTSWSRDGRFLLYTDWRPATKSDVWVVPLDGRRQPKPLLDTEFNEDWGTFSPDGRWIAYMSDESGRTEMYVKEVSPAADGSVVLGDTKWLISGEGAQAWPVWRSDSKQLSYFTLDKKIMAVDVAPTRGRPFSEPHALFTLPFPSPIAAFTGDMQRVLVAAPSAAENSAGPITVVVNWPALPKR